MKRSGLNFNACKKLKSKIAKAKRVLPQVAQGIPVIILKGQGIAKIKFLYTVNKIREVPANTPKPPIP